MKAIREYLAGDPGNQTDNGQTDGVLALGIRAGVRPDTISNLLSKNNKNVGMDFDIADRLLCAAHLAYLWQTRLSRYYRAVDLSGEPKFRAWVPELEERFCANQECGRSFKVIINYKTSNRLQKYCCQDCSLEEQKRNGTNDRRSAQMRRLLETGKIKPAAYRIRHASR